MEHPHNMPEIRPAHELRSLLNNGILTDEAIRRNIANIEAAIADMKERGINADTIARYEQDVERLRSVLND